MKKYINSFLSSLKNMFRGELVEVTFTPGSSNYTYIKIAE